MPELPEIEALRLYLLREGLVGLTVVEMDADWPGVEDTVDGMGGLSPLVGRRIEGIERRGKQLIAGLNIGVLGLHMGMTGRLGVMAPDEESFRYRRLSLFFDDERRLELDDVRRWAMVRLEPDAEVFTAGMGPDALDPAFTPADFTERVSTKRSPIKSVLLDQKVLAGVGNIYADEALLMVGITPSRRADKISAARLESLHNTIVGVLENALAFIESHPDDQGRPYVIDAQDDRIQITRKPGAPCPQCETPLKARKFGGRTAYYCPSCQH
jgi:formamidopyrimidine-DNA glycosylase